MANWNDMTDAQREEANEDAYCVMADAIRRAMENGLDLRDARAAVEQQLLADMAAYEADMRRAAKHRATKRDIANGVYAKARHTRLGFQLCLVWDVEP